MNKFIADRFNFHFITKGIATAALLLVSAQAMATPVEARFSMVENCQFLGKVEGTSGYGKNNGWQPLAKFSALRRAGNLGASHVVLEKMIPVGAFNGVVIARAFKCGN